MIRDNMPPKFQDKSIIWTFQDKKVIGATHLTTVAIYTKMRIFQICFFAMGYYWWPKPKKIQEQSRTPRWCAGAACQLLPRGAWRKLFFYTKMQIFQFCFLQWVTTDAKRLKKSCRAKLNFRGVCWSSLSTAS